MEIAVLGPLRVVRGGVELGITGRRRRALVCRLALAANRTVGADVLVEDIWEGRPTPGAASTLQSHVSAVRKLLGADVVRSQPGGYLLDLRPGDLDVAVVTDDAAGARDAHAAGSWSEVLRATDRALPRFRGPAYADADGAAWARAEVVRLDELRLSLSELRLDALLALGQDDLVLAEAGGAVVDHPLREHPWAQLMVALYRRGRRAEALRTYQRLRRELGDGLGLPPSPALVELEGAIATDDPRLALPLPWWRPPLPSGPVAPPSPPRDRAGPAAAPAGTDRPHLARDELTLPPTLLEASRQPWVGRAAERARVDASFADVGQRGGTLVVSGEGGIGKTTLLARAAAAAAAAADGIVIVYGRCLPDGDLCYQPYIDALATLAPAVRELVSADLDALGPLSPSIGARAGSGDAAVDRYLLFQGVERVLDRIAAHLPLAVVLDDLHWADAGTVALTRHLVDRVADGPVLLALGVRSVDVPPGSPVADLLADLHRARRATRVDLVGLRADEIEELVGLFRVSADLAADRTEDLTGRLIELTAGNPYFLCELLRHGWLVAGDTGVVPPVSVTDMVRRQAGAVGPDGLRLLSNAAVVGSSFDGALLAEVTRTPLDDVLDVIDAAIERGLVIENDTERPGAGGFSFAHAIAGTALLGTLSASRRRVIHRRAAMALTTRPAVPAAAVAQHWLAGFGPEDVDAVVDAVGRAGGDALDQLVPAEALRWFDRGLAAVSPGVEVSPTAKARLLLGRGRALFDLSDPAAGDALRDAARAARASGDVELLVAVALTGSRGYAASMSELSAHRTEVLQLALDANPGPADRGRLLAELASELMFAEPERASELARRAVTDARASGDDAALLHALRRSAAVATLDIADWIWPQLDEASRLAADRNDELAGWELAVCTRLLSVGQADRARFDTAAEAVAAPGRLAGLPRVRFSVALDAARVALVDGRPADADQHLDEMAALGVEHGFADAGMLHDVFRGAARRQLGDREPWVAALPFEVFPVAAAVNATDLLGAEHGASRLAVIREQGGLATVPPTTSWLSSITGWGYVAARTDDEPTRAEAVALLRPHAHRICPFMGPVGYIIGLCLQSTDPDASLDWLLTAQRQARSFGMAFAVSRIQCDLAARLLPSARAGDRARGTVMLARAQAAARAHGYLGIEREVAALIDAHRDRLGAGLPSTPSGTAR